MHFDTMTGMKLTFLTFCLLCLSLTTDAQTATDIQADLSLVNPEPNIMINSANEMASHLRSNYGIAKSVYLTQIAQQLSQSFASSEQLQQQWLQALATEMIEPQHFTQVNTHALMAQTLIQYTNGMTLNQWRQNDLPLKPKFRALNEPYVSSETFYSWLNLNYHWQQIFEEDGKNNTAQWLPWLTEDASQSTNPVVNNQSLLSIWHNKPINSIEELTALVVQFNYFDTFAAALMRQQLHMINEQTLALAYDWIEIYQLLELSGDLLTSKEQKQLFSLVSAADMYWTNAETEINELNEQLYSLIKLLFKVLPEKFKNPDHFNEQLNQQVFSLITGIQNPDTYFVHPLRKDIQENLEVCLNLSAQQNAESSVPIAENQFKSCLNEFVTWGTELASNANLAGNLIKLDNPSSINRALDMPSVQIINNLTMQAAAEVNCQQQLSPQVNWVEWLLAAETVSWFNNRWPDMMTNHLESGQIDQLIGAGETLYTFPDCLVVADPLQSQFNLLSSKWDRLKQEIVNQVDQYRTTELTANSDVDLFKSIDQKTNYIPEKFTVTPCDATQTCGALITLDPSKELLNLFPNHLILAEQFGLGQLEICYDQVQWQNRKTTPTHLDNNKIANFEGQLSIQLNGRYRGESVFTKTLLSDQRHVYLFGENDQETLDTSCPLPIVGKQINTSLDRGTFGLLPNRLTFLAAQKVDINAVMRNNWEEWQSQLNAEPNDFSFYNDMNEVKTTLNDAFLQRVNELQQQIYRKLITNNHSRTNDSALSKAAFEYMTHRKLLSHMTLGLFPQLYTNRPSLQAAISGNNRLVDMDFFREAFEDQTNVADMIIEGDDNYALHQNSWGAVIESEPLIHNTLDHLEQIKVSHQSSSQPSIQPEAP